MSPWVPFIKKASGLREAFGRPSLPSPPPPPTDPKAQRDALLTKVHFPGAAPGFYVPDNDITPNSVGAFNLDGVLAAQPTGTEYRLERGTQNTLLPAAPGVPGGGRVFTISTRNQKFSKVVFECNVTVTAGAVDSFGLGGPEFDDCLIAGPNPDQIQWEFENYPQRNAAGTSQWTTAACILNFSNALIKMRDTTVTSTYYKARGLAQRLSTRITAGLRGAKFDTYRCHIWGVVDPWNHNGVAGVTDSSSNHLLSRFGPSYYANRDTSSPYQSVQSGNDTHADGAQSNIGRFGKMRRCYIGGPHTKVVLGGAFDPGPIGAIATDCYYAALQLQQESGVLVDGIDIQDCWLAGGIVTANVTYTVGRTPDNTLPAPGLVANRVGNTLKANRILEISSSNQTAAGIYASDSINMDFGVGTPQTNVWWKLGGDPRGTGVAVPVVRKAND